MSYDSFHFSILHLGWTDTRPQAGVGFYRSNGGIYESSECFVRELALEQSRQKLQLRGITSKGRTGLSFSHTGGLRLGSFGPPYFDPSTSRGDELYPQLRL